MEPSCGWQVADADMLVNSPIGTKSAMRLRDSVTALSRKDKDSPLVCHYKDFNSQLKNYLSIAFSSDTLNSPRGVGEPLGLY